MGLTTIDNGFEGAVKAITGGTCTYTNDQISVSGGTCTVIGSLNNYTLNGSLEVLDATSFGDKLRKNITGFPSFTFSAAGYYDYSDAQQKAVWDDIVSTATRTEKTYRVHGKKSIHTIKGYNTSGSHNNAVGSVATFNMEMTLTYIPKTCTKA